MLEERDAEPKKRLAPFITQKHKKHVMIIRSTTKSIYYPTPERQSNIFGGSGRVRYFRVALLVRPKF